MDLKRVGALAKRWLFRIGLLVGVPYLTNKLGDLLNSVVEYANRGVMPCVYDDCAVNETHVIWQSGMHLKVLCDWIPFSIYYISPGDILILLGLWGAILGFGGLLTLAVHDKFHL